MSLCSACQSLLVRIILYQLGKVSSVSDVYGDKFGDGRRWRPTDHCLVCRVLRVHLVNGRRFEVRRCDEVKELAKDKSGSVRVALVGGSDEDTGLFVDLLNASGLLSKLPKNPGELVVRGPVLAHPSLTGHQEKYETIASASRWIRECGSEHDECRHNMFDDPPSLPIRVLDVAREGTSDDVRLVSGVGRHGKYAALSHCWGNGLTLTTTKSTLDDRQSSIPIKSFSPLFRDAVHIARELGLQYLWIDALCIIQDDWHDWESEAARMADIFRNAFMTIAATGAEDSSKPIYPSNNIARLKFTASIPKHTQTPQESITWDFVLQPKASALRDIIRAPLNRRAWVLQELILSRRTLHFAKGQVYWHCKRLAISADGEFQNSKGLVSTLGWYYGPDVKLEAYNRSAECHRPAKVAKSYIVRRPTPQPLPEVTDDSFCYTWWRLVEDYSDRQLSHLSDKLVALAGIASLFESLTGDTYLAGLWRRDLPISLLWYLGPGTPDAEPGLVGIPSWSWASVNYDVRMPRCYRVSPPVPLVEVIDVEIEKSGPSIAAQVLSGTITLKTDVITFQYDRKDPGAPALELFRTVASDGKAVRRSQGNADLDADNHDLGSENCVWALPVAKENHDAGARLYLLIVQAVLGEDDTWRRIGVGEVGTELIDMEYYDTKFARKKIIKLV